ncbi:hypothetical protein MMC12_003862 [Toensbergia leucococca]|nr:hypothetical protein [Toensbergia leucococca]
MPPQPPLLSPSELSYLHTSLSLHPPIRPDSRPPTHFRPLVAETALLPSPNGSARVCYPDGTEAIVGVKAEVERTGAVVLDTGEEKRGEEGWVEVSVEIPGLREDDAMVVFLGGLVWEAVVAGGCGAGLVGRLGINSRWHWRIFVDVSWSLSFRLIKHVRILLLSPPTSYPLPLLSLTTHLALLSTRLPLLLSTQTEDPLFSDDWDVSTPLYAPHHPRPPITLLVISVNTNIFFDPTREELAVADAAVAVSVVAEPEEKSGGMRVVAVRMVDAPSRMMGAGVPDWANSATGGGGKAGVGGEGKEEGVWRAPRGGVGRGLVAKMVQMVVERGGVGEEVLKGLDGVEVG